LVTAACNRRTTLTRGTSPLNLCHVLHAPDCEEAPQGAPLLDVEHALNVAENPGRRQCSLCGCAQELTPMLSGFDLMGWMCSSRFSNVGSAN
jgi:hypothetical protein